MHAEKSQATLTGEQTAAINAAARRRRKNALEGGRGLPLPPVTFGLIALFCVIFLLEMQKAFLPPDASDIDMFEVYGGLSGSFFHMGQWWRLFTAPLLHGDLGHVLFNSIALAAVGKSLERLIGSSWFGCIFAISALTGGALSLAFHAPNVMSIGASGGIVGLFGATALVSLHYPKGSLIRKNLMSTSLETLAMLAIPAFFSNMNIDHAAHFGGAAGGAALGALMLNFWPQNSAQPKYQKLAVLFAVFFIVVNIYALYPISQNIVAFDTVSL